MNTATPFKPPEHADAELSISVKSTAKPEAVVSRARKNAAMEAAVAGLETQRLAREATDAGEAVEALPEPREPVESVEVLLLDGRAVVFGPPQDISLTMRIAMALPEASSNPIIERLARVCMSVRSIDGQKPRPIGNLVDLTLMANVLGDQGVEVLHHYFAKYWGDIKLSELQLVKKICDDDTFRECVAVATFGQPWSEAKAMDRIERKAFIYRMSEIRGASVNWRTGEITKPPPRGA